MLVSGRADQIAININMIDTIKDYIKTILLLNVSETDDSDLAFLCITILISVTEEMFLI